jgi:hypothetical protein
MKFRFVLLALVLALIGVTGPVRAQVQDAPTPQAKVLKAQPFSEVVTEAEELPDELGWHPGSEAQNAVVARQAPVAQVVSLTPESVFNEWFDPLYGALFVIITLFSHLIPGLNRLTEPLTRAITIAILLGIGFILFGGSFTKIAVSWFISSGAYTWFIKAFIRSPKLE